MVAFLTQLLLAIRRGSRGERGLTNIYSVAVASPRFRY
jgi:hypothetical protein